MLNKIVATALALSVGVSAISQIEVNKFLQEMNLMQTQQPVETAQPAPTMGPYSVNSAWYKVPALDGASDNGFPLAWVIYPTNGTGPFPLISYQHGADGGSINLLPGYKTLFEQIASYGFVVAAADSCNLGCTDATRGAPWSDCGGLPN